MSGSTTVAKSDRPVANVARRRALRGFIVIEQAQQIRPGRGRQAERRRADFSFVSARRGWRWWRRRLVRIARRHSLISSRRIHAIFCS